MATYSHSRLKTFFQCPRKFLWHYVWNARPRVEGVEAFVGKRVHETLEDLYRKVSREGRPPVLRHVVDGFQERWDRHWSRSVRIVRERTAAHYREMGRSCLERYYRRHHPFDAGTTLAVEQAFHIPVEHGSSHKLRGYMDRIDVGSDGALEVHDYKTGRPQSTRDLELDQQVGFYQAAARHLYPQHRRLRLVWHFLRSDTEHRLRPRPPAALSALRRRARAQIEGIEETIRRYLDGLSVHAARAFVRSGRAELTHVPRVALEPSAAFPARVGPLCRWCSFLDWCREGSEHADVRFRPPPEPLPRPVLPSNQGSAGEQGQLF